MDLSFLDVGFVALGPLAAVLLGNVLPAVLTAAGVIGASRSQSSANRNATQAQTAANDRALAWEQEQDRLDRAERAAADEENRRRSDVESDREQARFDTETQNSARQEAIALKWRQLNDRRLQPYRDTGVASVQELGRLAGLTITPTEGTPDMAAGWDDSELSPPQTPGPVVATGRRSMSALAGGR